MKLHTVFVSFNRMELTKEAISSYLDTVTVPFTLAVVDNASEDGTQEWLRKWSRKTGHQIILLPSNRYPGFACNRGWELAPPDADFFQRADNDWVFLPGWCEQVERCFRRSLVGQVGLRTDREESTVSRGRRRPVPWNVGGNMVLRRRLWDRGLRYDERPWTELPAGMSEDSYLSPAVKEMGYLWTRVRRACIADIGIHEVNAQNMKDPYYRKSWADRGVGIARPPAPRSYRKSSRRR